MDRGSRGRRALRRAGALPWVAGLTFLLTFLAMGETVYVVQKNDTLTGVAREYGVTVGQLAERNGLSREAKLQVGQKLRIPQAQGDPVASVLPVPVRRAILQAPVPAGRWKYVVIHHSATDEGSVRGMDRYHREHRHMENGLAYHFVIGNGHGMQDGEVAVGRRWKEQLDGGHLASEGLNKIAVGICLVGNYESHGPTAKQLRSLKTLIQLLLARCDLSVKAVKTHQQINPVYTRCPGRHFPTKEFLKELSRR